MIETVIDRPVATAMIYLAVLALGVFSFLHTPLELAPRADLPQLDIISSWPGVAPEVVQTQVTAPLEEAVIAVKGVLKVSSSSETGSSRITVELDPRAGLEFTNLALREAIGGVGRTLPYGVRPSLEPYVPEEFAVRPFLRYTVSASLPLQELRQAVKDRLERGLGSVRGVARAAVTGGSEAGLRVVLDRDKLRACGVQPNEIRSALGRRLRSLPTGTVRKGEQEFSLRVPDAILGPRELGQTVVARAGDRLLRLRDLARIEPAFGEVQAFHRRNGRPTVSLTIDREEGKNALKTASAVKEKLAAIRRELPSDMAFQAVDDESLEIRKKLKDIGLLAGTVTAVIFLMVLIVLGSLKPTCVILSSIAFSVVITFNLIYLLGISMNMLTLGSLTLGFGLFVDNSIVVFENILRLRERGVPPRRAAVQGVREVFTAVLAATLTTVSVFFAFPYFQGRLRAYYLPLAVVMVSALSASLLVSSTLIPCLSLTILGTGRPAGARTPGAGFEKRLGYIIRHPVPVLFLVGAIFFGSFRWFRKEVAVGEFPRWYSKEVLHISLGLPPGTDLETTDGVMREFEAKVLEADGSKEMNTFVSPGRASAAITFPPEVERSSRPYVLKDELIRLAARFAGIDCGITGFDPQGYASGQGAGTFCDSSIKFTGYNLKKLRAITSDAARTLLRNPRIRDIRVVSGRGGRWRTESFEYVVKLDSEALSRHGIPPAELHDQLQSLLPGHLNAPLRAPVGGRETPLSIKFPEADLLDVRELQSSLFQAAGGQYLRLEEVSRLEERPIAGSIDRENQQYQQTLSWEFRGPFRTAENFKRALLADLRLPPGFSAGLDEPWRMTTEEKSELKLATAFSLVLIFMILAALFESFSRPLFIMLAVPLGLIGVFLAFAVSRSPFDASAHVGVILLGGIVVNNAILLVDRIDLERRRGAALLEAVLRGTGDRVRPVLMTTATTVIGLLPMLAFNLGAGRLEIWTSLALCTAGGLVSSTVLVLFIVPIFYFYGCGLGLRSAGKQ